MNQNSFTTFFKNNTTCILFVVAISMLISVASVSLVRGYEDGYNQGLKDKDLYWKKYLIQEDMAEYDSKTGEWKLKTLDDISLSSLILQKIKK